jgi:hypothetical protein
MNLGIVEDLLLRALRARLGGDVECRAGPAFGGPATGLRAQIFVHATGFTDLGEITAEGATIARQAVVLDGGASGFTEQRPGAIDIEICCVCARHDQAQVLAGLVVPALLEALETLAPPLLSDPADATRRLRFGDHRARLRAQRSQRVVHDGVAAAQVVLSLRLDGFLHLLLARPGGLVRRSAYLAPLRLEIVADPEGSDVQHEQVLLHNEGDDAVDLGGWTLQDAARRPHVYTFAATRRLGAGRTLRLWSGRGNDDDDNVYWGRRQAVWNNSGDIALLRDPDGVERARASWLPALPEPVPVSKQRRRPPGGAR